MRKVILTVLLLICAATSNAQYVFFELAGGETLPPGCDPSTTSPTLFFKTSAADGTARGIYRCSATDTWTLLLLVNPEAVGMIASTASASAPIVSRTITGTSGRITVTNGNGVSGNPTIDLTAQTRRFSIFNYATIPDNSGNVFFEPYSIKATNDRWPHVVGIFNDTATRIGLRGQFTVPQDYVTAANLVIVWTSTATSGDVEWDFEYRAVGGDNAESFDQTGQNESLNLNDTAPGAANRRMVITIDLTDGNFSAGDVVQFEILRDGTDGGDTIAAAVILVEAYFEYTN